MTPTVLLIRTAGTNCERELARGFVLAGATVIVRHLSAVIAEPSVLRDVDIVGLPGGFSYGDDIASGRILAVRLARHLQAPLARFVENGGLIIGICNGFQVLVKCGLLPGGSSRIGQQTVTLTDNVELRGESRSAGSFECRWSALSVPDRSRCVWTRGLSRLVLPIAHGEGRFVADEATLSSLSDGGQIALQYVDDDGMAATDYPANPNGSQWSVAGICDASGRIFGLMPHPERFVLATQSPSSETFTAEPPGLTILRNAVDACLQKPQLA